MANFTADCLPDEPATAAAPAAPASTASASTMAEFRAMAERAESESSERVESSESGGRLLHRELLILSLALLPTDLKGLLNAKEPPSHALCTSY